jgi:hypothetical protein
MTKLTENRKAFLFEEYRALKENLLKHMDAYIKLENYTFGGSVIVYGALFGITSGTPRDIEHKYIFVWWVVPILISFSCVRCWGHYLWIRKAASYFKMIEKELYSDWHIPGFEHFYSTDVLSTRIFFVANALSWGFLLAFSFAIAGILTWGNIR